MMKEKLRYYLIAGAIILSGIAILLVALLLPKDNAKNPSDDVVISTKDITAKVGEEISDFIEVSTADVLFSFSLSKEGIIEINDNTIYALSAGSVEVSVTATKGESIVRDKFTVTVVVEEYTVLLTPIVDCEFYDDTLYMTSNSCTFMVQLQTLPGETIISPLAFDTPAGVSIRYKFNQYVLTANENCEIKLIYNEINFEKVINVVIK